MRLGHGVAGQLAVSGVDPANQRWLFLACLVQSEIGK
jgi:hypothetical protein